jgi:hypothetical protein
VARLAHEDAKSLPLFQSGFVRVQQLSPPPMDG